MQVPSRDGRLRLNHRAAFSDGWIASFHVRQRERVCASNTDVKCETTSSIERGPTNCLAVRVTNVAQIPHFVFYCRAQLYTRGAPSHTLTLFAICE
jgi:hypothetical protein